MSSMYFTCNGCASRIVATDPRVQCLDCANYDLCTNCALGERFTGAHTAAHGTRVFKMSGGGPQAAVISAINISYSAPPLPPRPNRPSSISNTSTVSQGGTPPRAETPRGWGVFFMDNMTPTAVFTHLMSAILAHLDTGRTGYLVPEAFSQFLDDQGYTGIANTWKANRIARAGKTAEDVADAELRRVCDLFSIEYVLSPRPGSAVGGMMPLLSLKGFMDIAAIELLCDPSSEWASLSRAIGLYDLPAVRGWGDPPRSVLPKGPDTRMKARVARATAASQQQGETALAALRVKQMLQAQGEQNAMDLLDDRRYYYTYR